jgi:hypothetical protein
MPVTNPLPVTLVDDMPGMFDTLETWQSWLDKLRAMPDFDAKKQLISIAERQIRRILNRQEAYRLYQAIDAAGPRPPTMTSEREAEDG